MQIENRISRREFLKIGAAVVGSVVGSFVLSPLEALAQTEHEARLKFDKKIADIMSKTIHKGEKGYESYDLEHKYHVFLNHIVPFEDKESELHIKFQYVTGPKGGAGRIEALFYLEPYDWYSHKAIDNLKLWLFSTEETKVSTKIYEINVNHAHKTAVYESITERMLIGDYVVENVFGEPLFTLLSKLKVKKNEIKKFLKAIGVIGDIIDYWEEEEIKDIATQISGDHIWLTKFEINGFGGGIKGYDENVALYPNTVRAPKLYKIEIFEGAKKTIGFAVKGKLRKYVEKKGLVKTKIEKSECVDKAALGIKDYFYSSIKDEKFDENEIKRQIEKSEEIKAREIEKREFGEEDEEDIRIEE